MYRPLRKSDQSGRFQVNPGDAKEIFQIAANSGTGGTFGIGKKKLDPKDIQQAWIDNKQPSNAQDIASLLKNKFGFGDKEINKVFSKVFGKADRNSLNKYAEPVGSEPIQKMAEYAEKNGIADDVRTYLVQEFGKELGVTPLTTRDKVKKFFGKQVMREEIREIFEEIVNEERAELTNIIREQEIEKLGRARKSL